MSRKGETPPKTRRSKEQHRMFPLGHAAITGYAGHRLSLNVKVVLVAVMLPDVVDKPLALLGVGSGRYIGHSLLFVLLVALLLAAFRRGWGFSAFFGSGLHLVEDAAGFVPWLYPFQQYSPPAAKLSLASAYFNAWGLGADLIGAALLFALAWDTIPGLRRGWQRLFAGGAGPRSDPSQLEGSAESSPPMADRPNREEVWP